MFTESVICEPAERLISVAAEHASFEGGGTTQRPDEHTVPRAQARPQAPQFALSERRFTHAVPHAVKGRMHTVVHAPLVQNCPDGHARPQAPQLASSVFVDVSQPLATSRSQLA